jgi:hypothetical protein
MTSPADAIAGAVRAVTSNWAKQRKAEERNSRASLNRRFALMRSFRITIRDAAFDVMEEAYLAASDNGKLPVKPRQIMYAARPFILKVTGEVELNDSYFTQGLLIDYMEEYYCDDWDITWDARGHFIEPHTGIETALGTLEIRQYLGERPSFEPSRRDSLLLFPTAAAENRFRNVLFIEKEEFHPLIQAARLQERFDVAVMSTKGMSVTAARKLLDELTPFVDNILVLHDFDRSGFSIAGTIGTHSRRYWFKNKPPVRDIGLRLSDVVEMDLQSEPVPPVSHGEWAQRAHTLRRHGATPEEIDSLRSRRVEINALSSRQIIDFIEKKFTEYGVKKLIPDDNTLEQHARRVIKERLTKEILNTVADDIQRDTAAAKLPEDFREQLERALEEHPELPWDAAVALFLIRQKKQRTANEARHQGKRPRFVVLLSLDTGAPIGKALPALAKSSAG